MYTYFQLCMTSLELYYFNMQDLVTLITNYSPWYNRHGWLGVKNQLSIYHKLLHSGVRNMKLKSFGVCCILAWCSLFSVAYHLEMYHADMFYNLSCHVVMYMQVMLAPPGFSGTRTWEGKQPLKSGPCGSNWVSERSTCFTCDHSSCFCVVRAFLQSIWCVCVCVCLCMCVCVCACVCTQNVSIRLD